MLENALFSALNANNTNDSYILNFLRNYQSGAFDPYTMAQMQRRSPMGGIRFGTLGNFMPQQTTDMGSKLFNTAINADQNSLIRSLLGF